MKFLDTVIKLNGIDFDTFVFRKNTCTDVILNFHSVCPVKWKIGLILCFLNRAWKICSTYKLFDLELKKLQNIFVKNGYPVDFFLGVLNKFLLKKFENVKEFKNLTKDTLYWKAINIY